MVNKISNEEYFEKFGVPWLIGHLQMRSIGLQVFTAIQGGLIVGWASFQNIAIPILALVCCLSFHVWDLRVRFVLRSLAKIGSELIENDPEKISQIDFKKLGIFSFIVGTREKMNLRTKLFAEGSHTTSINILLIGLVILWSFLIITKIERFV